MKNRTEDRRPTHLSHGARSRGELGITDRPGKAVQWLCGDRTEIVRCSCRAVSADYARKSYDARAGSAQRSRGDGAETVLGCTIFFAQMTI